MAEKKHRFDKLQAYDEYNTVWIKMFVIGYINIYLMLKLYTTLSTAINAELWAEIVASLKGGGLTYAGVYTIVNLIQVICAAACAATSPMLGKAGFWTIMVHLASVALGFPTVCLLTRLASGGFPTDYILRYRFLYIAVLVFVVLNAVYFCKRVDLFYKSVTELVTGEKQDEHRA